MHRGKRPAAVHSRRQHQDGRVERLMYVLVYVLMYVLVYVLVYVLLYVVASG